ncbi:MAG: hypothetical protein KGL39_07960 [Patescibacteria group bacterium]|nr:hypothetical protein [Patescibacteria group bacterium]
MPDMTAPEPIRFACPYCQAKIKTKPKNAGARIKCPGCQLPIEVPVPKGQQIAGENEVLLLDEAVQEDKPILLPDAPSESDEYPVILGDRPRRESYRSFRGHPNAAGQLLAWGALGAVAASLVGLASSQYFPVFGGIIEKGLATPWSPPRMSLIPIHLFGFSIVGAFFGGAFGYVTGQRSDSDRPANAGVVWLWVAAMLALAVLGVTGYYVAQSGSLDEIIDAGELTDGQKATWKKKRRDATKGKLQLAICSAKSGNWRGYGESLFTGGFPEDLDAESVEGKAKVLASEPGTFAVALIDLYSAEGPRVVRFYRDDGNGVKLYPKAPTEESRKAIAAYFRKLQRSLAK